jgi:glutathione S-transferase
LLLFLFIITETNIKCQIFINFTSFKIYDNKKYEQSWCSFMLFMVHLGSCIFYALQAYLSFMRALYGQSFCPLFRSIAMGLREKRLSFEESILEDISVLEEEKDVVLFPHNNHTVFFIDKDMFYDNPYSIAEYLDQSYLESNLMGLGTLWGLEVRRILYWSHTSCMGQVIAVLFNEIITKRKIRKSPDSQNIKNALDIAKRWFITLEQLSQERSFLAGSVFSWADMTVACCLAFLDYLGHIPWNDYPEMKLWYMKIKSRPSFRPFLTETLAGIQPHRTYVDLDF